MAATVPMEDATAIAVLRLKDKQMVGSFRPPSRNHAQEFDWVSNERLLIGLAQKWGSLDQPNPTGELYAIDANGNRGELLVGYRVESNGPGTRIQPKKVEAVAAFLADDLPGDERNVLVTVWPLAEDPFTRVDRMDVTTGRRSRVASSPVRRGEFTTDGAGEVRFVHGSGSDNVNKLYFRERSGDAWKLINDEAVSKRIETALGFSADDSVAYLNVEQTQGRMRSSAGTRRPASAPRCCATRWSIRTASSIALAPMCRSARSTWAIRHVPGSSTRSRRRHACIAAWKPPSGRRLHHLQHPRRPRRAGGNVVGLEPGDFYVYDTVARKADHLISRSDWIDVERSASVKPIALKARDGLPLHGFLTLPAGSNGRNLPMVVMPHGGPFDIFDSGQYDRETQMLAAAGYAVLQVNFRGSGNYGRAHTQAGAQQWGAAMQDDVTDATRWAISEGIADGRRICIYGASYGAYSAMMGAAREPGLYQCAAGYVGVYDLPMMYTRGDIQDRGSGVTYLREWLGDPAKLGAVSPVNLAERIKVPVFLAAGGEDKRAPIQHTERMEAALKRAGTPVESLYYKTEGHGFYTEAHRSEYYDKLLAFLARSLGARPRRPRPRPAGQGALS